MQMRFVYILRGVFRIVAWCRVLPSSGCLLVLLVFMLTACSFFGGSPAPSSSTEQLTPTSSGILLGEQPCPAAVQDPAHWDAIVGLGADQTVERVSCGNLVGLSTLQAVVAVRHTGSDHILDVFIYSHLASSEPSQLFALRGLLHGDVKISGYNTVLTAQSDPRSSLNKELSSAEFEQDLFREFKWSDSALTFVQVTFSGIFPDMTRFQAEREQVQVNNGQGFQQWRLSVVKSAQNFANAFLNWSPAVPVTVLSGGGAQDYKAVVQVHDTAPGGGMVRISFSRLEGNNNGGLWEATAIETDGLSITSPQSGQSLTSPILVKGANTAFAGKALTIKVLDHAHADIGHATVAAPGNNGATSFSSSVPYASSFQGGGQEGIVAVYAYNANGSIAAVAMVKVLLGA
jgi:Immunoglobulin-like domain of bacterial spore germination